MGALVRVSDLSNNVDDLISAYVDNPPEYNIQRSCAVTSLGKNSSPFNRISGVKRSLTYHFCVLQINANPYFGKVIKFEVLTAFSTGLNSL